ATLPACVDMASSDCGHASEPPSPPTPTCRSQSEPACGRSPTTLHEKYRCCAHVYAMPGDGEAVTGERGNSESPHAHCGVVNTPTVVFPSAHVSFTATSP